MNTFAVPMGWSEDINLTKDDDNDSRDPSININGDNIHVIWGDSRHYPVTNRAEIYYINSTNEGKTWNHELRLTYSDSTKLSPRLAVNSNNVHIIWTDDRDGGREVFYKNSSDSGKTWCVDRKITKSSGTGYYTDIAVNNSNIHVVYIYDFKLFYLNSTDNGITWSEPQQLTGPIRDSNYPAIAVNGSNVHIVWMDHSDRFGTGTAGAIFYINSTDNGLTWSEDFNLSYMNLDAGYSDIAVEGENVHVLFNEQRSGLYQLYYRRSEDNGITWTEEFMVSNTSEDIGRSVIRVKENSVYASWDDEKNPIAEVYLRNSSDNGQNWDNEIRITHDPAACAYPSIAFGNQSLHLIWSDWRNGAPEIYYKYYPFYPPPTNLTIEIQGTILFLNWTPPQNSPSPVSHYNIYRSTTWDGFDFSVPWVNTSVDFDNGIIPLRTTWNDTFAYSDDNNYFYIVRAMNNEGWNDTNTNIVGKYVMSLEKYWNLISLPLVQKDTNISKVLGSIDGDYNIVQWYDAKEGKWRSSTFDLTEINRTMGFWIHLKNTSKLKTVGSLSDSTDIALYEGWNLVGYPSLKLRELNDAFSGINWKAVQCYDAFDIVDPWKHNKTNKPEYMNDLKEMKPGLGYWIYVTINETWIRTRTIEDEKVVVWRVGESEEKIVNNKPFYDQTFNNMIEMEEEDNYKMDDVDNENPIIGDKDYNLSIALIPLIILIALILAEIGFLYKIRTSNLLHITSLKHP